LSKELVDNFSKREGYSRIKKAIEKFGKDRDKAYLFLDSLEEEYRSRLLDMDSSIKKEIDI
jgi:hypothetical protein